VNPINLITCSYSVQIIPTTIILVLPAVTMSLPIITMLTQDLLLAHIAIMTSSYNGDDRILAVALGIMIYVIRKFKWARRVVITLAAAITTGKTFNNLFTANYEWMMVFAIIPIMLYNDKRSKALSTSSISSIQPTSTFSILSPTS